MTLDVCPKLSLEGARCNCVFKVGKSSAKTSNSVGFESRFSFSWEDKLSIVTLFQTDF